MKKYPRLYKKSTALIPTRCIHTTSNVISYSMAKVFYHAAQLPNFLYLSALADDAFVRLCYLHLIKHGKLSAM